MELILETKIVLKLDSNEAKWLKSICQNKIHPQETEVDSKMREMFFEKLHLV